jgi:hypothetical protein
LGTNKRGVIEIRVGDKIIRLIKKTVEDKP